MKILSRPIYTMSITDIVNFKIDFKQTNLNKFSFRFISSMFNINLTLKIMRVKH